MSQKVKSHKGPVCETSSNLVILADGKTEAQKEIACTRSQRKPAELLRASYNLTPLIPSLGSLQHPFCALFNPYPLHVFPSETESYFHKNSDIIGYFVLQNYHFSLFGFSLYMFFPLFSEQDPFNFDLRSQVKVERP